MPSKYPVCTSSEVVSVLNKAGFIQTGQKGSHLKFVKDKNIVIVPIHRGDLKTGTLKGIIMQAGMTVDEFKAYL